MKTLIIYVHLLAACLAIGILILQDLALVKTQGRPLSNSAIMELERTAKLTFFALGALWISGLLLIVIGYMESPNNYLFNEKLWAKFTVVFVLTLNGLFLHNYSFPKVISPQGVNGLSINAQFFVLLSGAISSTSWFFASFLGIARSWNNTVSYSFIIYIYIFLIIASFIVGSELLNGNRKTKKKIMIGQNS
jgi:hypothetical protein